MKVRTSQEPSVLPSPPKARYEALPGDNNGSPPGMSNQDRRFIGRSFSGAVPCQPRQPTSEPAQPLTADSFCQDNARKNYGGGTSHSSGGGIGASPVGAETELPGALAQLEVALQAQSIPELEAAIHV